MNHLWLFVDYHRWWELNERHCFVTSIDLLYQTYLFFTGISHPLIHSSHLIQKNAAVGVSELHFQLKGCSILRFHLNGLEITDMLDELNQWNKQNITIVLQICASSHENVRNLLSFWQLFTCACSSSLSFFISTSFFSMRRKSVMPYSMQMRS